MATVVKAKKWLSVSYIKTEFVQFWALTSTENYVDRRYASVYINRKCNSWGTRWTNRRCLIITHCWVIRVFRWKTGATSATSIFVPISETSSRLMHLIWKQCTLRFRLISILFRYVLIWPHGNRLNPNFSPKMAFPLPLFITYKWNEFFAGLVRNWHRTNA